METTALQYFVRVCDNRSISKAAEACFVSRQAVSQALLKLENEVGAQLILRRHNGIEITEEGLCLYRHARQVISLLDDAQTKISEIQSRRRKCLRVGFGFMTYNLWAGRPNKAFAERYPNIEVQTVIMLTDDLREALKNEEIDVAISNSTFDASLYQATLIKKMPVICIFDSRDPLAEKQIIHLEDFENHTVMLIQKNEQFRRDVEKTLRERHICCPIRFAQSYELLSTFRELRTIDKAIHITSNFFVDLVPLPKELVMRKLDTTGTCLHKNVRAFVRRTTQHDPVILQYVDGLRAMLKDGQSADWDVIISSKTAAEDLPPG